MSNISRLQCDDSIFFQSNVITFSTNKINNIVVSGTRGYNPIRCVVFVSPTVNIQKFGEPSKKGRWDIIARSRNARRSPARRKTWNFIGFLVTWLWQTNGTWFWSEASRIRSIQKFAVYISPRLIITSQLWVRIKVFRVFPSLLTTLIIFPWPMTHKFHQFICFASFKRVSMHFHSVINHTFVFRISVCGVIIIAIVFFFA